MFNTIKNVPVSYHEVFCALKNLHKIHKITLYTPVSQTWVALEHTLIKQTILNRQLYQRLFKTPYIKN